MTSNNETVSRQMPRASNIANTMTSNGKQFTVTREMLTAVARQLSIKWLFVFHRFDPSVLLYNKFRLGETLTFEGNKIHCSPRDQSLSDLLYSKTNGSRRRKTTNHFIDKWRATAVNISRVTVNCFPFDVIVFAMLPAHDMASGGK